LEQTAVARGGELGATPYTDYRRMLEAEDLDAVDICLPHHLHRDAIVAAAQAGKHILCEKPLCLTVDEAADVRAAVRTNGVTLMCAHNQLFLPAVAKAKELLDAGTIGTVYEVRTTDSFYNDFDPSTMGWRASSTTSGGGELIDTGYQTDVDSVEILGLEHPTIIGVRRGAQLAAARDSCLFQRVGHGGDADLLGVPAIATEVGGRDAAAPDEPDLDLWHGSLLLGCSEGQRVGRWLSDPA
jgi:hypothetical protein